MGVCLKLVDEFLILYLVLLAVLSPLVKSQGVPCEHLPRALLDVHGFYNRLFGDYLMVEKPHFFVGIMWLELGLLWPLSIANLYGVIAAKPWFSTTCLIHGVSVFTVMVAKFGELIGAGRAPVRLQIGYGSLWVFGALAIVRGLLRSGSAGPSKTINNTPIARKKRS